MSIDGLSDSDCQQGRLSECKSLLGCVFSDEFFVPLLGDMDEPRNARNRRKRFLPCLSVSSVVAKEKNHGIHGTDGKRFLPCLSVFFLESQRYRLKPFIVIKPCGKR